MGYPDGFIVASWAKVESCNSAGEGPLTTLQGILMRQEA